MTFSEEALHNDLAGLVGDELKAREERESVCCCCGR
jgi:hypothetical protein